MILNIFALCMVLIIIIATFSASQLTDEHPLWVRLIMLSPAFTAMYTLLTILDGSYVTCIADILRAISVMLVYAMLASRLSENPWLDIRVKKQPLRKTRAKKAPVKRKRTKKVVDNVVS